ncbi:MBL fold metallo-hydrolase [Kineococcus rhizosphaerae]|uniref:Glyoxylase-like metal-dependent hydrolase (Beta-lactamase superfamily II) n=1 Tax=Kineococcus rhizosphaerae TaxID=559628 RepID=A0A2T0R9S6_9ACTN|nr:MBL fold metallo-hydrolase [Kineococcus rhizosphaerae]PRY17881.1 glyoxylase-like metal-dependent hydrolase (beta-lactamase superfamily II) [Kineococcus rhizosphaerae]
MLIDTVEASVFGTNCYVLAPQAGAECVIVDPGVDVADRLAEVLRRHRLKPVAVLLTHGHLDHTYSVTPVCGAYGVAATVHADDAHRLRDPLAGLGGPLRAALEATTGTVTWREPDEVVEVRDGARLALGGLEVGVSHAPGHTEGSVLFSFERGGEPDLLLSGDVLFAGSIGRTDLPGGSSQAMVRSLLTRILPLDDATDVLPGHGPATTIGRERRANPHLLQLQR